VFPTLLAASLLVAAPRPKDRPDADPLLGRWAATSLTVDGNANPQWAGLVYEFQPGGRWVIYRDGRELTAGAPRTYAPDSKARPAAIDLTEGAGGGKPYLGVYEVKGDTLTLSMHTGGGPRPPDFSPGAGRMTFQFSRLKGKK
jgi:uncharacterized protein (TIGR03067 family)